MKFCHFGGKSNWKKALAQAQEALILMQELMMQSKGLRAATHPMALAIAHVQIGWAMQRCQRLEDARTEFDKALDFSHKLPGDDPEQSIAAQIKQIAHENMSLILHEEQEKHPGRAQTAPSGPKTGSHMAQRNRIDGKEVHPFLSKKESLTLTLTLTLTLIGGPSVLE